MDILFTKELIKCTTGLDVSVIKRDRNELMNILGESISSLITASKAEKTVDHLINSMSPGTVYEVSAMLGMCYTAFIDRNGDFVLIGPCVEDSFSLKQVQSIMQSGKYSPWAVQAFVDYCRFLPVVSHQKRHQIANLLAKQMLGSDEELPFRRVNFNLSQDEKNRLMLTDSFEDISTIRLLEKQQQTISALTEAVKQGNLSLAYSFLNAAENTLGSDSFTAGNLRHVQNNCIILNTRLQRAMEDCGIHPYELVKIHSEISHHIENIKNVKEGSKYLVEIIRRYCNLARDNQHSSLASFSRQVAAYIKNHLSDNISVKSTAAALLINPDYLSNRFHKETGETFISFLNRERIQQAALLLKNTDMLIKDISSAVGYNNTSYFAKQFTAFTGLSPREYRSQL